MSVKFLSHADQSEFSQVLQGNSELKELFPLFMAQLELNSDYDSVMVSFNNDALRATIEDSPFVIEFDESSQSITLYKRDDADELDEVQEWDFDDDSVEEAVDYISDQVLEDEVYVA